MHKLLTYIIDYQQYKFNKTLYQQTLTKSLINLSEVFLNLYSIIKHKN